MQKVNTSFLHIWPIRIVLMFWGGFVLLDYLFHHPYYEKAFLEFRYWGLLLLLFSILGGSWFFLFKLKSGKNKEFGLKMNGLSLYSLLLSLTIVAYGYYCSVNGLFTTTPLAHLAYFAGHSFMLHFFVFSLFLMVLPFGISLMNPFEKYFSKASFIFISLGLGLSIIGIIAVCLGLANLLNPWMLWAILLCGVILGYRSLFPVIQSILLKPVSIRLTWQGMTAGAVLCIFIVINAIGAIKRFPVGFDGANLYANISKLIGEYNGLPEGGQAFNWSVVMSFGELLFNSTAVSILLSHLAGILCLIAVFRIGKLFLSSDKALLATSLFYIAPYITFHNIRDEKVDLGFLFISLTTLLLVLEFQFYKKSKDKIEERIISWGAIKLPAHLCLWILAGWLTGFAFGIKYIALLNFIALIAYLFYSNVGKGALVGILSSALGTVFLVRVDRFAAIDLGGISPLLIAVLFLITGGIVLFLSFRGNLGKFKKILYPVLFFTISFGLSYAPWAIKHLSENQTINFSSVIQGKSPQPVITIKPEYYGMMETPLFFKDEVRAQFVNQEEEKTLSASEQVRREELHRYRGFEKGLPLYLSLPYDLTMSTNIPGRIYLDIGFLFLLLFPLLLLTSSGRSGWKNGLLFLLLGFLVVIALPSIYGGAEGFNSAEGMKKIDELVGGSSVIGAMFGGIYKMMMRLLFTMTAIFYPVYIALSKLNFILVLLSLIALSGLLFWIGNEKWKTMPTGVKALAVFTLSFLFFWLFLGNGIPWYGFPAFSLIPILLMYYFYRPEEILGEEHKVFFTSFFSVTIVFYLGINLISQFHNHNSGANAHVFLKTPFVRYAGQQMKKSDVLAQFNPFFPAAMEIINGNPEAKVHRVGTYLNYHILHNDRRVYEDNQLGFFDEITSNNTLSNHFFQILKENGFRYIIYDLRTAAIDRTPEKSLTKKNQAFVHQLLNSGKTELLVTDRIVEDPTGKSLTVNGMTFPGKAGLIGNPVYQGSFALFEIK